MPPCQSQKHFTFVAQCDKHGSFDHWTQTTDRRISTQVISELSKRVEPRRQRRACCASQLGLNLRVPLAQTCQFISDYAGKLLLVTPNWKTQSPMGPCATHIDRGVGPVTPQEWKTFTVLDQCHTFYVNPFTDVRSYMTF